jgi:hypothetical protein
MFLDCFNMVVLKIIFFFKYFFNIFLNKKYFKKIIINVFLNILKVENDLWKVTWFLQVSRLGQKQVNKANDFVLRTTNLEI